MFLTDQLHTFGSSSQDKVIQYNRCPLHLMLTSNAVINKTIDNLY